MPGGFVDVGDSPSEAAVREAVEEAGVVARVERLAGVFDTRLQPDCPPHLFHIHKLVFVGRLVDPDAAPCAGSEATDAALLPGRRAAGALAGPHPAAPRARGAAGRARSRRAAILRLMAREVDLLDPDAYARNGYPWQTWAELRRHDPVSRRAHGEVGEYWALVRHAEIVAVSRRPRDFVSGIRGSTCRRAARSPCRRRGHPARERSSPWTRRATARTAR